jgi:hypothetical protein
MSPGQIRNAGRPGGKGIEFILKKLLIVRINGKRMFGPDVRQDHLTRVAAAGTGCVPSSVGQFAIVATGTVGRIYVTDITRSNPPIGDHNQEKPHR